MHVVLGDGVQGVGPRGIMPRACTVNRPETFRGSRSPQTTWAGFMQLSCEHALALVCGAYGAHPCLAPELTLRACECI